MFTLKPKYRRQFRQVVVSAALVLAFVTGCEVGQGLDGVGAPPEGAPVVQTTDG